MAIPKAKSKDIERRKKRGKEKEGIQNVYETFDDICFDHSIHVLFCVIMEITETIKLSE